MSILKRIKTIIPTKEDKSIVVVSGLPRSGTSLMMQMLVAGGLEPLVDHIRTADDDNPKGYYEFERVKKLRDGDFAWLEQANGKVVKIISALLLYLPADHHYKVVFMRRALPEILASQKKMLENRGENPDSITDDEMGLLFTKHLQSVEQWFNTHPNVSRINIDYNALVKDPAPIIKEINRFFDDSLDLDKMTQMVDPSLYRLRGDKK